MFILLKPLWWDAILDLQSRGNKKVMLVYKTELWWFCITRQSVLNLLSKSGGNLRNTVPLIFMLFINWRVEAWSAALNVSRIWLSYYQEKTVMLIIENKGSSKIVVLRHFSSESILRVVSISANSVLIFEITTWTFWHWWMIKQTKQNMPHEVNYSCDDVHTADIFL